MFGCWLLQTRFQLLHDSVDCLECCQARFLSRLKEWRWEQHKAAIGHPFSYNLDPLQTWWGPLHSARDCLCVVVLHLFWKTAQWSTSPSCIICNYSRTNMTKFSGNQLKKGNKHLNLTCYTYNTNWQLNFCIWFIQETWGCDALTYDDVQDINYVTSVMLFLVCHCVNISTITKIRGWSSFLQQSKDCMSF